MLLICFTSSWKISALKCPNWLWWSCRILWHSTIHWQSDWGTLFILVCIFKDVFYSSHQSNWKHVTVFLLYKTCYLDGWQSIVITREVINKKTVVPIASSVLLARVKQVHSKLLEAANSCKGQTFPVTGLRPNSLKKSSMFSWRPRSQRWWDYGINILPTE